jgi:glutaminyl-tRNA synthetase
MSSDEKTASKDFIRQIVADDLATGKQKTVVTRFPPEPNGYLHIGHAKSITLNFGVAGEVSGGKCHLRFDDSNPETEDMEYVQSIQKDVKWLGYDWGDDLYHASDYFEALYGFAVKLIEQGKAYVCSLTEEDIRKYRGTVTSAGTDSPNRDRSVEENLDLFARMKAGEFADGEHVLRAKIDMGAPNMKMRDPLLYRIRHAAHYRTGSDWCIYPMYDFTHCLSDALENITHSICTLEFENNRELYDWIIDNVPGPSKPLQYEFARLNLNYTVLSKRKLIDLVQDGHVNGWDDPRLPTIAGLRRRGITPEAIRNFCERIGVAKANSVVDMALLEHSVRDDLNTKAPRVMGVLDPLKVVIVNYPEDQPEPDEFDAPYLPDDPPKMGTRKVPFAREIYIERKDFMEEPPKKFFRLAPGREVRLRWAYFITCVDVVKDDNGEVVEIHCEYDPATRGGDSPDGRKVKGTIHWVSAEHSVPAEVRLYDRLFTEPNPDGGKDADYIQYLNPHSLDVVNARVEPSLASALPGDRFQFERTGYFIADSEDHSEGNLVFNRIVPLRDSWAKIAAKEQK